MKKIVYINIIKNRDFKFLKYILFVLVLWSGFIYRF